MNIIAKDICNLSRIPIKIENNPIYKTALQLLNNPNLKCSDSYIYKFNLNFSHLGDVFGVNSLNKNKYTDVFIPWLHNYPLKDIKDEAFVNFNKEKKFLKIKNLLESIIKFGYIPEKFPDRKKCIRGYWLEHKGIKKTYIVSGNHRAAILKALDLNVPFKYENPKYLKTREIKGLGINYKNYPTEFSTNNVEKWPSVISGYITKNQAIEIASKYFK